VDYCLQHVRVVAIVAGGLLALALVAGAGSTTRAFPAQSGPIVFVAANGDIKLVDPQTKAVRLVTSAFRYSVFASPTDNPQLSPDGSLIAFASGKGMSRGGSAIWLIRPDGTGATRLTEDPSAYDVSPAWSPDGKRLLFSHGPKPDDLAYRRPPYTGLWSMRPDGTARTKLANTPEQVAVYGQSIGLSPDGTRIVYAMNADRFGYLPIVVVADADGRNARPVAGGISPAWSPDGRLIVFLFPSGDTLPTGLPRYDVVVMSPDGQTFRRLPRPLPTWAPTHVRWAPEGEQLIVSSLADGASPSRLYLMNVDGSGLVDLGVEGLRPDWGPPLGPRRCRVPAVRGRTLPAARKAIALFDCSVGKLARSWSASVAAGRVISQQPAAGKQLARGAKVTLVVSRGQRR
jgi:TolB protein